MKTTFHKKNFALSLPFKRRRARTPKWPIECFPHVISNLHRNKKSSIPGGLIGDTNMAAMTSGENTLLFLITGLISETKLKCSIMDLMVENDLKGNQLFLVVPSCLEQGP